MRVQAEVLAKVLREKGLDDATISEILATAQVTAKTSQSSRRSRAKLVKSEKLDEATMEQFRQQLLLREWEKSVRSRLQADFQATGVQVSPSRSIVVFRQDGIVTMAEIRHSIGRQSPYNRRFIAQKLKQVKAEKVELVRLVVSAPDKTIVVTPVGSQRGVVLPESERRWLDDCVGRDCDSSVWQVAGKIAKTGVAADSESVEVQVSDCGKTMAST
jgi:hypothetical protein